MEIGLEQRLPVVTRCRENKTKADGSPNCPSRRSADAHFASLYTTLPHFLLRCPWNLRWPSLLHAGQYLHASFPCELHLSRYGNLAGKAYSTNNNDIYCTEGVLRNANTLKGLLLKKMLDTPQKLGFIFLCPSGKMPSSHAIKMTHAGMTRCVLLSCLDGLMLCVSVSVQLWHLSHRNPFHYSPTEERATH